MKKPYFESENNIGLAIIAYIFYKQKSRLYKITCYPIFPSYLFSLYEHSKILILCFIIASKTIHSLEV